MQIFKNLCVISVLLAASVAWGQTTVFSDDFSTDQNTSWTTSGQIGSSAWYVNRLGDDWGARRNTSPAQLELTNDVGSATNANGWVFAYVNTSGFSLPYNKTLSSNTDIVTWYLNMRQIRSDPAGFVSGSYGVAFILAGSSTTTFNNGTGYAIALGQSGTTDPIRLVKYNAGITSLTNIITSNTSGLTDFGNEYLSIKVTYNPSNNQWELFLRNDGTTEFTDPKSGSLTSQGTATDDTYTSTALEYMGAYWQGATGSNQTAFFDNISVIVGSGTQSVQDGDGTATISNNISSGVLKDTDIWQRNSSSQSVKVTITGVATGTLTSAKVTIPSEWSGLSSDNVTLSGDGFNGASKSVSGQDITITNAALTNTATGTVTITGLTTPNPTAVTDDGRYTFKVYTAKSGGTLTEISSSPVGYVIIPIANIRDVNENGVANDLNETVVVEGVATVGSGTFSSIRLDVYIQDAGNGINLYHSTLNPTITKGKSYIIKGSVIQYNGKTEISPSAVADIIDNGTATEPNFLLKTIAQLLADPEAYEGMLIGIQHLNKSSGTWGSNVSLTMTDDGGTNTLALFIDGDTDADDNSEPTWPKDVVGIFAQYDNSSPYTSGYQIIPRAYSDIQQDGSLPVELESFAGELTADGVKLTWATASEIENQGFNIYRKLLGGEYLLLASFVNEPALVGAGSSSEAHSYSWLDRSVQPGATYNYLLADVSYAGVEKKHTDRVVTVVVPASGVKVAEKYRLAPVYPNPFNASFTVPLELSAKQLVTIRLFDTNGKMVQELHNTVLAAGIYRLNYRVAELTSGVYFLKIGIGDELRTQKVVLLK